MAINETVLIDTGPLVAFLNRNDAEHHECAEVFHALPIGKAHTCWAVLTEAVYLLRVRLGLPDPSRLLDLIRNNELTLSQVDRFDVAAIQDVYRRFFDQQVDLVADATLLAIAEREDVTTIFTTDRRDFRVYRRVDGRPFRLLPDDYAT